MPRVIPGYAPGWDQPMFQQVRVARLGLMQAVASGPCLLVLPMEMRRLHRPSCARHLVGLPSLSI
jgi:hypothetical protein